MLQPESLEAMAEESRQEEQQAAVSSGSSTDIRDGDAPDASKPPSPPPFRTGARFWAIIITCAVIGLLSALENTVVTTALPRIVTELDLGENYIWVTNVFFLTG